MIYEINHIWTAEMKWKWRNDRSSERNLCNCVKKPEKNSGFQRGLNPWPRDLPVRCSTNWAMKPCPWLHRPWSHVPVLHVLVIQSLCEVVKWRTEITPVLQSKSPLVLAINSLTCLFLGISAKTALIAILFLNNNSLWSLHLFQESHIKAVRERALPTVTQHLVREIVSPNQTIRQQVQNAIRLLYFKSRQTFFSLEQTSFKF